MRLFRIFIFQLWLLLGFIPATATEPTTGLLPEVKTILTLPPFEESWLENNLYVDLAMLLYAPNDYHEEGKKLIRENYQLMQEWLTTDRTISATELSPSILGVRDMEGMHLTTGSKQDPRWKMMSERPAYLELAFDNDWTRRIGSDVITEIKYYGEYTYDLLERVLKENTEKEEYINESDEYVKRMWGLTIDRTFKANQPIITRYDGMYKKGMNYKVIPNYATKFSSLPLQTISSGTSLAAPMKDFSIKAESEDYHYFSEMMQTKGIYLIAKGKVKEGLDRLQYDYDVNRTLITGEGLSDSDSRTTMYQIRLTYLVMAHLLTSDVFNNYLDHPLIQSMNEPIFTEESLKTYMVAYLSRMTEQTIRDHYILLTRDRHRQDGINYPWGFYSIKDIDVNSTINLLYLYYQMVQEHYQKTERFMPFPKEKYTPLYIATLAKWQKHHHIAFSAKTVKDRYDRLTMKIHSHADLQSFLYTYQTAINLQRLVQTQLAVKRHLLNKKSEDFAVVIPQVLAELENTVNQDLFTKKPFIYDPAQQWLIMQYFSSYNGFRYKGGEETVYLYEEGKHRYTVRLLPKIDHES